jgi:hypothetical protein
MSVVNRVRFTAWAWLASAFLLGAAVGVFAAGIPLWKQLQAARDDAARLEQVERLTRRVEPGTDAETLASLEEPAPVAKAPASPQTKAPEPAQASAAPQPPAPTPVAEAAAAAPVATPVAALAPSEAERKAADARKASEAAAAEAERRAKAERQAKLEREQKLAKAAAQEAEQKKAHEREQAEARAAAARVKPPVVASEAPARKDSPVQIAAPTPVAGTNAPTERVTKEEAGLSEVQTSGVTFKSGRRVGVGDTFPSGEKLISVDPVLGEIITSKRRIVIKAASSGAT